jgi:hypothetical protein
VCYEEGSSEHPQATKHKRCVLAKLASRHSHGLARLKINLSPSDGDMR